MKQEALAPEAQVEDTASAAINDDDPPKKRIKKRSICFALIALTLLGVGVAWGATNGFQGGKTEEPETPALVVDKDKVTEKAEEAKQQIQETPPASTTTNEGSSSNTGSTNNGGGNQSNGNSTPSTGGNSGGGSTSTPDPTPTPTPDPTPEPPAHQHNWVAQTETINHPAEYEQQWVPNMVYVPQYTCGTCGAKTYSIAEANAHQEASGRGGCGAYYTSGYYEDQGSYQTVLIRDAWTETITKGYACSGCGAWQ